MKITNKHNLPEVIYDVLTKSFYDYKPKENAFSVTEILNDSKEIWLKRRHRDEITVDACDFFWTTYGNLVHEWVSSVKYENALQEKRFRYTFENGVTISGQVDLHKDNMLNDFKFTSVWSWIYRDGKDEWMKQLNIYRWLLAQPNKEALINVNGKYQWVKDETIYDTQGIRNILLFRDWQQSKAEHESNYPNQIEVVNQKMWDLEKTESFIKLRLSAIMRDKDTEDDKIKPCSEEARWEKPTTYAVKKKASNGKLKKRATKVCKTMEEAEDFMRERRGNEYDIEVRDGECTKCERYCDVRGFCNFYKLLHDKEFEDFFKIP